MVYIQVLTTGAFTKIAPARFIAPLPQHVPVSLLALLNIIRLINWAKRQGSEDIVHQVALTHIMAAMQATPGLLKDDDVVAIFETRGLAFTGLRAAVVTSITREYVDIINTKPCDPFSRQRASASNDTFSTQLMDSALSVQLASTVSKTKVVRTTYPRVSKECFKDPWTGHTSLA